MFHRYYLAQPEMGMGGVVFGILGFLFWAAVIWFAIALFIKYHRGSLCKQPNDKETPLEIAQARYARGEITSDEYAKLKKDLSKDQ